jgi:hypothetical protein
VLAGGLPKGSPVRSLMQLPDMEAPCRRIKPILMAAAEPVPSVVASAARQHVHATLRSTNEARLVAPSGAPASVAAAAAGVAYAATPTASAPAICTQPAEQVMARMLS